MNYFYRVSSQSDDITPVKASMTRKTKGIQINGTIVQFKLSLTGMRTWKRTILRESHCYAFLWRQQLAGATR